MSLEREDDEALDDDPGKPHRDRGRYQWGRAEVHHRLNPMERHCTEGEKTKQRARKRETKERKKRREERDERKQFMAMKKSQEKKKDAASGQFPQIVVQ